MCAPVQEMWGRKGREDGSWASCRSGSLRHVRAPSSRPRKARDQNREQGLALALGTGEDTLSSGPEEGDSERS